MNNEAHNKKYISIFYSWQSGQYDKENRYLIGDCLKDIAKRLSTDGIAVQIEQDTRGSAGSADIPQTLFNKIENADIFIGDISIINPDAESERKTPNPNVMIELGYAAGVLKWERVISVFNLKFGTPEHAPFDIRHRRIITYDTTDDISKAKKALTSKLLHTINGILPFQQPNAQTGQAKTVLSQTLMQAIRYAWYSTLTSEENKPTERKYISPTDIVEAPIVLESHFQHVSYLQDELSEQEFFLLTHMLDIIHNIRNGTEEAYGWEYAKKLSHFCFENIWLEYCDSLVPVPMEKCLRLETVQLLNHLLPPENQLSYESLRTTETGETVFYVDDTHLEAYSQDGAPLINVELDSQGRITGWKKDWDYQGNYAGGLRHGDGIEYSHSIHHLGEVRLTGRWNKGKFAEGTVHQAILFKDEAADDGFTYEPDNDDFPLQVCTADMESLLYSLMPDECENLYAADMHLHDGVFDIMGTPVPLCCRLGGEERPAACFDCPKLSDQSADSKI